MKAMTYLGLLTYAGDESVIPLYRAAEDAVHQKRGIFADRYTAHIHNVFFTKP